MTHMSVDDILNDPKLSSRMRRRRVRDNISTAAVTTNSNTSSGVLSSNGGRGNNAANSSLQQQTSSASAVTSTQLNPGQEERKKRLERLQREQLVQRRLLGQQQQQQQQTNGEVGRKLFQQQPATEGKVDSVASQTTTTTAPNNLGDDLSSSSTMASPKRRSPRNISTRTVTTYNVTELSKRGIISNTTGGDETTETEEHANGQHYYKNDDDLDDTIEQNNNTPTTVEAALTSLLSKYDSCICTTIHEGVPSKEIQDEQQLEDEEKSTAASASAASASMSKPTVSPWSVIQVLPQLLQFVHLKQPTSSTTAADTGNYPPNKSGIEQEKHSYIQKELSKVVISVGMMKRRVMDRTIGLNSATADDSNTNDEEAAAAAAAQQQQLVKREASLLQMIQIQLWIRMMMWSLEGEVGWTYLEEIVNLTEDEDGNGVDDDGGKKQKKKKKKKKKGKRKQLAKGMEGVSNKQDRQTPRQALVDHLTALFELVPYVLPPSMDFSVWVKDILTFGYRQNIPEYGAEILEHFEIELVEPIALKRSGTDTSRRSTKSEVSHSPVKNCAGGSSPSRQIAERRAKRQQAYFASLMEEEKASVSTSVNADDESATITGSISTVTSTSRGSKRSRGPDIEKDDTKLLKTSVSLTAAVKPKCKENPFLKGSARGTYVGSHLSSKLSNISTLFREVTVPVKKPKMKTASATTSLLANNKRKAVPKEKKRKVDEEAGPKAPFNITAKVNREQQLNISGKTRVRETPTKKLRVDRTSFLSGRAETYPPLSTPRRIIEETPAKARRVVISETPQQQPRFRRQQLDLSDITRHQQEKRVRNHQHASNNINNNSLSPMIQYGGLSPMPQKKNVVAEAAKAAARKRK